MSRAAICTATSRKSQSSLGESSLPKPRVRSTLTVRDARTCVARGGASAGSGWFSTAAPGYVVVRTAPYPRRGRAPAQMTEIVELHGLAGAPGELAPDGRARLPAALRPAIGSFHGLVA